MPPSEEEPNSAPSSPEECCPTFLLLGASHGRRVVDTDTIAAEARTKIQDRLPYLVTCWLS